MKFISWNVNGFRAWIQKKEPLSFIQKQNPDFFCLQETKANPEQIQKAIFDSEQKKILQKYPFIFFNTAEKKGYSGTAIFSKKKPLKVTLGIGDKLDNEGRVITLEFSNFFLVTVYTPNSKPDLARLGYRYKNWDKKFLKHLQKLKKEKEVICCGDLNVAHTEIDLKNPQTNKTTKSYPGSAGFTDQEKERFGDFLKNDFIDTFRFLHPEKIQYTWWSYRFNARKNNTGWRIDYFLTSQNIKNKIKKAEIFDQALGSDHCPVGLEISL